MDVDANALSTERRLTALERFLDTEAPGWRTGVHRSRRVTDGSWQSDGAPRAHPDMHVDEDQTARDRELLGYDRPADEQRGPDANGYENDDGTLKPDPVREQVLADLEPFRGVEGYAQWDGTERTDQLQGILATSLERKAAIDRARAQEENPTS